MPEKLKDALISPIIKTTLMDNEILQHFRPMSNLVFISKLIEKAVANHMDVYMGVSKLYECMQSVYRKEHSTEQRLLFCVFRMTFYLLWMMCVLKC